MSSGDSRPPSDDTSDAYGSRDGHDASETHEARTSAETHGVDSGQDILTRFRTAQSGPLMFIREVLTSVLAVALIGLLLFTVSGVWPPMVAVESGSMEPHMHKGDLIFVTEPGRFAPDAAYDDTGIVTYEAGKEADYRTFGSYGSVIIYDSPERFGPPVIHRARFWVDEGENWYPKANKDYVTADNCEELNYCPAPHAGFITKGDANSQYDQASRISSPVKPQWVQGVARIRIPYLGWVRLGFSGAAFATPADASSVPVVEATNGAGTLSISDHGTGKVTASEPTNATVDPVSPASTNAFVSGGNTTTSSA